ncbi:MAG TPA: tripartite tricarboxylate transporter substrate binding protein [Roseomonas sp.]|jgi:tripartite-type tricarboxylate transporter receptor subunit TctC
MPHRRSLLALGALRPFAGLSRPALAQIAGDWRPERSLSMIVAFAAGGGTDIAARLIGRFMERDLGQAIVVLNRPGAAGELGFAELARARPDGYTIGFINTPHIATIPIERRARFALRDFAPIANIVDDPSGLWVMPNSPYRTLADLIEDAKRRPETIGYGTTGVGSDDHLAVLALERAAGIRMLHVPYSGGAPIRTSLAAGTIPVASTNLSDCINDWRQGSLRPLVQMGATRWDRAPELPTARELGYDIVEGSMRGMAAPAGVPAPVLARLALAVQRTVAHPDFKAQAAQQNLPLRFLGPDAFADELNALDTRSRALWSRHPWHE